MIDTPIPAPNDELVKRTYVWDADKSETGWGVKPKWCVGINNVGHKPIAWVYSKEDAEFFATARETISALQSQLARQGEALRPFVNLLAAYEREPHPQHEAVPDNYVIDGIEGEHNQDDTVITYGDLRRAAAALSTAPAAPVEREDAIFKNADEAIAWCERIYKETGGVSPALRKAYEFYLSVQPTPIPREMALVIDDAAPQPVTVDEKMVDRFGTTLWNGPPFRAWDILKTLRWPNVEPAETFAEHVAKAIHAAFTTPEE